MKRWRRNTDVFNLSFLDCICCGFGAIILLFVLSKFAEPLIIESVRADYQGEIARLQEELFDLRGETAILLRDLEGKRKQLSDEERRLARLRGDLSRWEGEFAASKRDSEVQNKIAGQMAAALQDLTKEMERLLKDRLNKKDDSVGGIPVDSEYIVFIIDTSGSMQRNAWALVLAKLRETLKVYPRVKGIQIMNDMGTYMFSQYRGKWIPDTPARRKAILANLTTWHPFSNSSPVEGITAAIRTFYDGQKKISLYVFGDEFSGEDMQGVVDVVDRINRVDKEGNRRVRIHAVGFPVMLEAPAQYRVTGIRFAALMRVLCERNGGTFVGLNSTKP